MLGRLSKLLIDLRNGCFRACDYLFRRCCAQPPREDGPVLVLRPDGIGDFVLWCETARFLREVYAPRKIILAANQLFADLAESTGYFDQVIPFDIRAIRRNLVYHVKMLFTLSRVQPTIILHPVLHRLQFHDVSEAFVRAIPACEVVGWALEQGGTKAQRKDERIYTRLIQREYGGRAVHVHNATFLMALGAKQSPAQTPRLPFLKALPIAALLPAQAYFVLFPAASSAKKRWPAEAFAEIGRRLHAATGWVGWVAGAQHDVALCAAVCQTAGGCLKNCAGELSLPQLAELIRGARLLLSNDTGAAHIGGACQTPTVCILGGGHYGEFLPYKLADGSDAPNPHCVIHPMPCFGCGWQCIFQDARKQEPVPCIARISVDEVWASVENILERKSCATTN
jgi:ADP-heptose:LPS heptosyltransferase